MRKIESKEDEELKQKISELFLEVDDYKKKKSWYEEKKRGD
jgi:hypothetical protein